MNWFERHLNWTLIICWIFCVPIYSVLGSGFIQSMAPGGGILSLIVAVILLGLFLWTAVWVVKRKNQSLLWLFFLILPIVGVIFVMMLDNRNERQVGNSQGISKAE